MIELNYTNINKAMNISVQSVFHGGERGKKNFTEGNRRLPIFYNNGDTGATSPRPYHGTQRNFQFPGSE